MSKLANVFFVLAMVITFSLLAGCGGDGVDGLDGNTGDTGSQGEKGAQGDTGNGGAQGETGDGGDPGNTGAQGEEGVQGETGNGGAPGNDGEDSANREFYTRCELAIKLVEVRELTTDTPLSGHYGDVSPFTSCFEAIHILYENGVLSGGYAFRPTDFVQDDEMAKMVAIAGNFPVPSCFLEYFKDVPIGSWSFPYIMALAKAGVLCEDEECDLGQYFYPAAYAPREWVDMVLANMEEPVEQPDICPTDLDRCLVATMAFEKHHDAAIYAASHDVTQIFSDVTEDMHCFVAVHALHSFDVMDGYDDGTFDPSETMTNGEVSEVVLRVSGAKYMACTTPLYDDLSQGHPYFSAIQSATLWGFMCGTGTFKGGCSLPLTFGPDDVATLSWFVKVLQSSSYPQEMFGFCEDEEFELMDNLYFYMNMYDRLLENSLITAIPAPEDATFMDLPSTYLGYQKIETLFAYGIVPAGNGNFYPSSLIQRDKAGYSFRQAFELSEPAGCGNMFYDYGEDDLYFDQVQSIAYNGLLCGTDAHYTYQSNNGMCHMPVEYRPNHYVVRGWYDKVFQNALNTMPVQDWLCE